jgi:hypothetical protein
VNPLEGLGRDAAAVAQARDKLAIVDDAPPEGALRHADALAERGNLTRKLIVARASPRCGRSSLRFPADGWRPIHADIETGNRCPTQGWAE